jgi:ribosomal protein S27AE
MSPMTKTFGMEYGDVVERIACPRCQAHAVIRARPRAQSRNFEEHIVCGKCHLVKFSGMTTTEAMLDQRAYLLLSHMLDNARTTREKQRIKSKLEEIEGRLRLHGLLRFKRSADGPTQDEV